MKFFRAFSSSRPPACTQRAPLRGGAEPRALPVDAGPRDFTDGIEVTEILDTHASTLMDLFQPAPPAARR